MIMASHAMGAMFIMDGGKMNKEVIKTICGDCEGSGIVEIYPRITETENQWIRSYKKLCQRCNGNGKIELEVENEKEGHIWLSSPNVQDWRP